MSISLNTIDCPYLTDQFRENLIEKYSIHTINDFIHWLSNSSGKNHDEFSTTSLQCIQTCIIAHTARICPREKNPLRIIRVNYPLFDQENFFETHRHILIFYQSFNQYQWNELFNHLLIRIILNNPTMKISYWNTNVSLFDRKYFHSYLKERRDLINEDLLDFNHSFDLETFEKGLTAMENGDLVSDIFIIDDFFALIKPYLNLDRRIRNYILQLIYRLNRLAQTRSMLILTGWISPWKKRMDTPEEERFLPADKYLLFQSLIPTTRKDNELHLRMIDEKTKEKQMIFHLNDWTNMQISSYSMEFLMEIFSMNFSFRSMSW